QLERLGQPAPNRQIDGEGVGSHRIAHQPILIRPVKGIGVKAVTLGGIDKFQAGGGKAVRRNPRKVDSSLIGTRCKRKYSSDGVHFKGKIVFTQDVKIEIGVAKPGKIELANEPGLRICVPAGRTSSRDAGGAANEPGPTVLTVALAAKHD